jgi:hypothetical protein
MESYLDGQQVITTRFYDAPEEAGEIHVVWNGPLESLVSLKVAEIRPISESPLTT